MSIVITALKKIYEEEGVEIYQDPYRYYSLAEDYISDRNSRFLEQLYYCAENHILEILYKMHTEPSYRSRERLFQKAKLLFLQNQKYSAEDASAFFQNYMDAFGWKIVEPKKVGAHAEDSADKKNRQTPVSDDDLTWLYEAGEIKKPAKKVQPQSTTGMSTQGISVQNVSNRNMTGTPARKILMTASTQKPVKKKKKSKCMFLVKVGIVVAGLLWGLDDGRIDWKAIDISDPVGSIKMLINSYNSNQTGNSIATDNAQDPLSDYATGDVDSTDDTSVYQPVTITYAYASSVIDQPGYDNSASVMFDGDLTTSWQEGVDGYGIGETAGAYFDRFYDVKYISFNLGNWRNHDYYDKNGVPDVLKLTLGNFSQDIQFPADRQALENTQWVEFTEPVHADSIELEIRDVLAGNYYEDTCITEITIYGM